MAIDVKTYCLGILSEGPASGYEIKKRGEEGPFAAFFAAGFGSIYPALTALAGQGLVAITDTPPDGRPERKVYRITPAGRMALVDALAAPPAPDRVRSDFLFILYYAHLLAPRLVDTLIDQRIAGLRREVVAMQACAGRAMDPGARFCVGYGLTIYEAEIAFMEANRHALVGAIVAGHGRTEAAAPAAPGGDG